MIHLCDVGKRLTAINLPSHLGEHIADCEYCQRAIERYRRTLRIGSQVDTYM